MSDDCCGCEDDDSPVRPSLFDDDRAELQRRDIAKILATTGGVAALASFAAPIASLQKVFQRTYTGPIYGEGIPLVDGEGTRITPDRLAEGEQLTVFPEPRPGIGDAPTLLVRFPESAYGEGTELPFTVDGYAAYSKICTHAGCTVSGREGDTLVCPCHYGKFDPTGGARVVGGPPPRPLPQLPLTLASEGHLIATGDFEGPVGSGGE